VKRKTLLSSGKYEKFVPARIIPAIHNKTEYCIKGALALFVLVSGYVC